MTRYARGNKGNRKRPYEASSWNDLTNRGADHYQKLKTEDTRYDKPKEKDEICVKRAKRGKKKLKHRHMRSPKDECKRTSQASPRSNYTELKQEDSPSLHSSLIERLVSWNEERSAKEAERSLETDRKKEKRKEERRLKRIKSRANKMVCYHCREAGHGITDCPKMLLDQEQGTGICFRCGSTEHEANKCTAKVNSTKGEFPFAKCFICQEMGHLSRSCPDNPRGLYPLGGGCKHCGSVEHRKQHCPHSVDAQKDTANTTLPTLRGTQGWSADAVIDEIKPRQAFERQEAKQTPKVIKF
ncbi:zinc finger CCHC domain-containing protein 9-like [Acanthaster planci]|uniref:Zinc finger CCHC domain-containing protein 9-like n=1 Tax=Acanthaster planci TaxID=133434 RepID=A0A8B7ZZT1_ACAPL|nr:zinc finger CCHC domain-containing protein 9-like [Acanthaster planci]